MLEFGLMTTPRRVARSNRAAAQVAAGAAAVLAACDVTTVKALVFGKEKAHEGGAWRPPPGGSARGGVKGVCGCAGCARAGTAAAAAAAAQVATRAAAGEAEAAEGVSLPPRRRCAPPVATAPETGVTGERTVQRGQRRAPRRRMRRMGGRFESCAPQRVTARPSAGGTRPPVALSPLPRRGLRHSYGDRPPGLAERPRGARSARCQGEGAPREGVSYTHRSAASLHALPAPPPPAQRHTSAFLKRLCCATRRRAARGTPCPRGRFAPERCGTLGADPLPVLRFPACLAPSQRPTQRPRVVQRRRPQRRPRVRALAARWTRPRWRRRRSCGSSTGSTRSSRCPRRGSWR